MKLWQSTQWLSKHEKLVLDAVEKKPLNCVEISKKCGVSKFQTKEALCSLVASGFVLRRGHGHVSDLFYRI